MNEPATPHGDLASDASPETRSYLRWWCRGLCLLAATALLFPLPQWRTAALWVPALSPFVAAASLLATRVFHLAAIAGLLVAAIALFSRRWFCRWVCPTGLCADAAGRLGRSVGCRCPRMPPLGQWIALLTLAGACLGYPLLLWLDPLAFFAGLFSLRHPLSGPAAWLSAMGVPVVLLLSLFLPGAWCARICPLGAMQDLLSRLTRHATVARQPVSGDGLLRRIILAAALGTVWAATVRTIRGSALLIKPLRPPGAIAEPNFLGVCIRCGNCTRICPSGIVAPDLGQHGLAGLLAPVVRFRHDYCREDCTRCMDVCPSGALQRLSVAEKRLAPLGLPRVDMNVCLLADDRECSICKNSCSYEAIALVFSPADYVLTPHVDPHKCPGCGACEAACPTTPTRAIVVYPLP